MFWLGFAVGLVLGASSLFVLALTIAASQADRRMENNDFQ